MGNRELVVEQSMDGPGCLMIEKLSAGRLEGDIWRCTLHTVCAVGFLRVQSVKLKLTVPCSYLGSNLCTANEM
jgi:hexokinase